MASQIKIFGMGATNNTHYHCNYIHTLSSVLQSQPDNSTYNLNKSISNQNTKLYNYTSSNLFNTTSYYKLLVNDDSKIQTFNNTLSNYDSSYLLNYKIFYNGDGSSNKNKVLTTGYTYVYENPCQIIHPLSTLTITYGSDIGVYGINNNKLKIWSNTNNAFGFAGYGTNTTINCTIHGPVQTSSDSINYSNYGFGCVNNFTIARNFYIWDSSDYITFNVILNLVLDDLGNSSYSPFTSYYSYSTTPTCTCNGLSVKKIVIKSCTLNNSSPSVTITTSEVSSALHSTSYCYIAFSNSSSTLLTLNNGSYPNYINSCSVVTSLKAFLAKYKSGNSTDPNAQYNSLIFPEVILFKSTGNNYSQINNFYGLGYITINDVIYHYSASSSEINSSANKYSTYSPYPENLIERFGDVCTINDKSDYTSQTSFFQNYYGSIFILTGAGSYYCTARGVERLKLTQTSSITYSYNS